MTGWGSDKTAYEMETNDFGEIKQTYEEKKAILDKIFYNVGKQNFDFFLAGTYEKDGEKLFTKWKKYSECVFPIDFDGTCDDWKTQKFFESINQRQIFPNELILDVEEKSEMKEVLKKLDFLEKEKAFNEYKIYFTGSKGYHIHLFFKEPIEEKFKLHLIKYFKVDEQKAAAKTLIAIEKLPHWKTGNIKTEITKEALWQTI